MGRARVRDGNGKRQHGLVDTFRTAFPDTFTFEGNRAIVFDQGDRVPVRELTVCIATALTYHRKASRRRERTRRS